MFMDSKWLLILSFFITHSVNSADLLPKLGKDGSALTHLPEWNLTISPDGENLPVGKGSAEQGKIIFANKCSACHGPEGIGGSAEPLMGEIGSLTSDYPEKTVNSYWPYATTLYDYIRRAMPIGSPFSLTPNEVYALCAYILSYDGIIDPSLELNQHTLPKVTMPNRDGFITIYPEIK